jgi:hypothetical protein
VGAGPHPDPLLRKERAIVGTVMGQVGRPYMYAKLLCEFAGAGGVAGGDAIEVTAVW